MQVVIHAGVAFSDNDCLIETLLANADGLQQQRIVPLDLAQGRQFVKVASDAMAGGANPLEVQGQLECVLPDRTACDRVIVSSDKAFGPRRTAILDGQFYPLAGERTAFVDRILNDEQIELFFGVMNPATFISKTLMSLPEDRRKAVLDNTDISCLSWLNMIEDLRDQAPDVQLTLWANEDTPLIWGDILRALAGLPEDATVLHEYAFLASLLTDTGRAELAQLVHQIGRKDRDMLRNSLAHLFDEHADPAQIEEELELPGWNADLVGAFSEIYEQDLAKIRSMPGVRVLQP